MMEEEDYPGRWVIEALTRPNEPKLSVESYYEEYENSQRASTTPAFQALRHLVVAHAKEHGDFDKNYAGIPTSSSIEIPWWIAVAFAESWATYRHVKGASTFGQAFGIEGRGQGTHSSVSKRDTERTQWGLALEVAAEVELKNTVTTAIITVAERWDRSYDSIRNLWKAHGKKAKKAVAGKGSTLKNYGVKSSRS